jgi:hypothetical protein
MNRLFQYRHARNLFADFPQGVVAGGLPLKDCGNDENSTIAGMTENSTEGWGSLAQHTRAARVGFSG